MQLLNGKIDVCLNDMFDIFIYSAFTTFSN